MQTELEKHLRNEKRKSQSSERREKKKQYTRRREKKNTRRSWTTRAALRIKEKLKTRKVTTKTQLHEPLFMPLMNANKLKWLKKETKTYAPQKEGEKRKKKLCTKDIVCCKRDEQACARQWGKTIEEWERPNNKHFKSRKRKQEKSNRIKYLNKHSSSAQAFAHKTYQPRTDKHTYTHS